MFCVKMMYTDEATELEIVKGTTSTSEAEVQEVMTQEEILTMRSMVRAVPIADDVAKYAIRLVRETRGESTSSEAVRKYGSYGASPRASQSLVIGAKAKALLAGRFHVDFEDVKAMALPVLRHRLVLNFRAKADGIDSDKIITDILAKTPFEG